MQAAIAWFLSILIAHADAGPKFAADAPLADYLAYAEAHNPGVKAAHHRWQAALAQVQQADTLANPVISYSYYIDEVETRVGPQEQRIGLSQMFPWFGTLALREKVASDAAMTAEKQYEAKKQRLFHQVKVGYYELYYLRRSISITEDNIELLKHLESVAQAKYRAGATVAGVIKAQIELGKLADRLRSLNDVRGPVVARLNAALNRPAEAPLPWPQDVRFNEIELDGTKLLSALRDSNPELLGLDFVLSKEERAIGLARKAAYPGLMLGVDYIDTGDADNPGVLDSGKDPLLAKIALDLPVWRGKNRSAVIEAERRRDAAAQERVERGNRLAADLSMVVYKHRDAERKIDLYRDTLIPQAEQSLNVTEEAYRTGSVDFLSLIDAHRLLLEFQLSHERALVDRAQQLSKIEMIVGIDLSNKEGTP